MARRRASRALRELYLKRFCLDAHQVTLEGPCFSNVALVLKPGEFDRTLPLSLPHRAGVTLQLRSALGSILCSILCSALSPRVTLRDMNTANQPNVKFVQTPDYREAYSNSVQIRVNVWDFFLVFGTMQQSSETHVELRNFQGIYLSPQQAKALMALLQQNVANYESAFGEIKLDPRAPGGPVH